MIQTRWNQHPAGADMEFSRLVLPGVLALLVVLCGCESSRSRVRLAPGRDSFEMCNAARPGDLYEAPHDLLMDGGQTLHLTWRGKRVLDLTMERYLEDSLSKSYNDDQWEFAVRAWYPESSESRVVVKEDVLTDVRVSGVGMLYLYLDSCYSADGRIEALRLKFDDKLRQSLMQMPEAPPQPDPTGPVQLAPYVDEHGRYVPPLNVDRKICMELRKGDVVPFRWGDISILNLYLSRQEGSVGETRYHLVAETAQSEEQSRLRDSTGLPNLEFQPIEFQAQQNRMATVGIKGVAELQLFAEQSEQQDRLRLFIYEVRLDRTLLDALSRIRPVTRRGNQLIIEWEIEQATPADPVNEQPVHQLLPELGRSPAGLDEVRVKAQVIGRTRADVRQTRFKHQEIWPATMTSLNVTPRLVDSPGSSQTIQGQPRLSAPEPLAETEIQYRIPCLREMPVFRHEGVLKTDESGIAILELSSYADVATQVDRFEIVFALSDRVGQPTTASIVVPKKVWLRLGERAAQAEPSGPQ